MSFHKLAPAFDNASTADSSPHRLQRFIAGFDLCSDLIARLVFGLLPEKTALLVIISFNRNEQSFLDHRERWQVDTLFKYLKISKLDVDDTHLQDIPRIEKLLCMVMVAFVWCYKVGDYLDRPVKPIPIKKHGHREKSSSNTG